MPAEGRRGDREEDRDFWIDKEGIPHWNGVDMVHLKQYRARVRLEYETIIGDREERAQAGHRQAGTLEARTVAKCDTTLPAPRHDLR